MVGQSMVDGIPLAAVAPDQIARVCEVVWTEILEKWAGEEFDVEHSTVADLLHCELGDSFRAGGWLREWAEEHRLLTPAFLQLPGEAPLPNPWRLFDEDLHGARAEIDYLVGRTHGDLHGDNVLVPEYDKIVHADDFRLIDLATYDPRGPLSRDLATLLLSLGSPGIGESTERSQEAFLTYLERDRRDDGLDDRMLGEVRGIIDALREPTLRFVVRHNWESVWHPQLKVSLLAQAMLHSAYTSGSEDARRWCSRLAGRLTRRLLGPLDLRADEAVPFDAGDIVERIRTAARPVGSASEFVDRIDLGGRLRVALKDPNTSVIVVSGPPGIGKTALVRKILAELGRGDPDIESSAVGWHDAAHYGEIGVLTLLKDIEPQRSSQVAGPPALARLVMALDRLKREGGVRPVIVLDTAEDLLKEGHLRDPQLDLALDAVQGRRPSLAKVVFVTQHPPVATTGVTWTDSACRISLEGLEPPSLAEYFAKLDPDGRYGLTGMEEDVLRSVHGRLEGNPRLAELLHACLSSERPALPAGEVASWLSTVEPGEMHQRLARMFVDWLPYDQQRVAEAVAALGVPVDTETVISVLEPDMTAARVGPALRALVAARLVLKRGDGRVYLRKNEIVAVLGCLAQDNQGEGELSALAELGVRAADALAAMQKDVEDVRSIADLDMHFARVDLWLRAGMYGVAHDLIDSMDKLVQVWGSGAELRTQREAVRGRLQDDWEGEMINLAALGDIYSLSSELPSAQDAYDAALTIAKEHQAREAIRRVHIGMGSMYWEHDDLANAEEHYRWALGLAGEDDEEGDDGGDRAAALLGLADCRQRHGDYQRAAEDALAAFGAARGTDCALASGAALRLVRWYAEPDQIPDALRMLADCKELIQERPDPSARADLLDSTANLHLYRDLYSDARTAARGAVDVAREYRDPINLRRALTTLALTHVHLDDFLAARTAIEESARYRVAGRDTVELALRGIIAHRLNFPATARDLFQQLHHETSRRTGADENDLAAWDFTGIARCYSVLLGDAEPATALEAFSHARPKPAEPTGGPTVEPAPRSAAVPTPGLDDRLRFMVETLANGDTILEPVLSALARIRPGRDG
ncbi:hypothetical protein [Actinomadura meridiana]|uniref:hypothetical protein n=1 Tax=Actinomadura meridiana TaxID=559626 RepID=UPI0031E66C02